jgi:hypothetical protein
MNRLDGAPETKTRADFLKGEIGLGGEKNTHLATVAVENDRLAPAAVVHGSDAAGVAALLNELLDHAQRHLKASGHLITGHIPSIIGFENARSQIHGNRCHEQTVADLP